MNIAVIFAGGVGKRMRTKDKPKQFLMIHGKPIIVHTIEAFQYHEEIDAIFVACVEEGIPYLEELKYRYRLDKISDIVPGGKTGQLSIYAGLCAAEKKYGSLADSIVLIHDGVRPLIDAETISANIRCVKEHGSAVTCAAVTETVVIVDNGTHVGDVIVREKSRNAKAPQSFYLRDILSVQRQAIADGITDAIDSCTLMRRYGRELHTVEGSRDNIKITTPEDFYIYRALYDARENNQLV